ncbi:MAG: OmpA family protein [Pseudomonadota bacterium]
MRTPSWKWLWGLIPVSLVGVVLLVRETTPIENDLVERATALLQDAGQEWAELSADGRDLSLSGTAPTPEDLDQAMEIVGSTWGVRVVEDQADLLPEVVPYTLRGSIEAAKLDLVGFMPNAALKNVALEAASSLGANIEVSDGIELARGVSDAQKWSAASVFGLELLKDVETGSFQLTDEVFSFSGVAKSQTAFETLNAAGDAPPDGFETGEFEVLPPRQSPFTWGVVVEGTNARLTGYAPDAEARATFSSAIEAAHPNLVISNEMELASGVPDGWADSASFVNTLVGNLSSGTILFSDEEVSLSGDTETSDAYRQTRATLENGLPIGFTLGSIALLAPPQSPYQFAVERDAQSIILSGFAPSLSDETSFIDEAKQAFPDLSVRSELELAAGAPNDFAEIASQMVGLVGNLAFGSVRATDDDVAIDGLAASQSEYASLREAATGLKISTFDVTPPLADNFRWSADYDGSTITLEGFVPSDGAREAVLAAVRANLPSARVRDEMELASGLSDDVRFEDVAYGSLAALSGLSSGRADLEGTELVISGTSPDGEVMEIDDEFEGLGIAVTASLEAPEVSPYRFNADWQGWGIILTGHVSDEATRQAILESVARNFGRVEIESSLSFGSGHPDEFQNAVTTGLRQLSRLATGQLALRDTVIEMNGIALTPRSTEIIPRDFEASIPGSFTSEISVSNPAFQPQLEANACEALVDEALATRTILFESGEAAVASDSVGLIDQLTAVLDRCPGVSMTVEGHTDAQGSAASNMTLSQNRAEAVVARLIEKGIESNRLTATGFGETRPIADNGTDDGRARNRRIEFSAELR